MDFEKTNKILVDSILGIQEKELKNTVEAVASGSLSSYTVPRPTKKGMPTRRRARSKNVKGKSKVVKSIPKKSVIPGYGGGWGSWGDDLALVFYTNDFDIENLTKKYTVWYAIDVDTSERIKAIPQFVYDNPDIKPSNVPFNRANFQLFKGMVRYHLGTFEKPVTYTVKMKLKTLTNDERRKIIMDLEDKRYRDVGGRRLTKKDWQKMLGMTYDEIVNKMPLDKVDEFERSVVNAHREWANVKGVYAQAKNGDLKFILKK